MHRTMLKILAFNVCLHLCTAARAAAQLPPGVVFDPAAAEFIYDDLNRFAALYPALKTTADTIALLDSAYFGLATEGLRVNRRMYQYGAQQLKTALQNFSEHYALTARVAPGRVRALEPAARQAMQRLKELYPGALFPRVYYLVGPRVAGGSVQREGVFIAVETHAAQSDRSNRKFDELLHLVMHELVHFQQAAPDPER